MSREGIKPKYIVFWASVLTIKLSRHLDVTTVPMATWLCCYLAMLQTTTTTQSILELNITRI